MKLSDYIVSFLQKVGVDTVFGVTGGAIVHFFHSADKYGMKNVFTHHEQSAAFAAQAYARIKGFGAAFFTTGPGGTNAVTGIAAAWLDSIPTIYIGGQVRTNQLKPPTLRQQGAQEVDVRSILAPIVKYAVTLKSADQVCFELEKCYQIALEGRPGPVFLEVPLDLHWAQVEKPSYHFFSSNNHKKNPQIPKQDLFFLKNLLKEAKAPLLLFGGGTRLAKAEKELQAFIDKLRIPYVTTWTASDLFDGNDPLHLGHPGMFGSREANLAVQACDLLLCIGTHLSTPVTTANYTNFAKNAKIVLINIDDEELKHYKVNVFYKIHAGIKEFFQEITPILNTPMGLESWLGKCRYLKSTFKTYESSTHQIDNYVAVLQIARNLDPEDIIVLDGGGTIVQIASQVLSLKKGQRFLMDAGLCSMGSGLPQSIGAAFSCKNGNIICFCGDGSFQFNIQELQTIFYHQLPIKIFLFNNEGYLSIRHTQKEFLEGNFLGSAKEGGISTPDIQAIAKAYKITSLKIENPQNLQQGIQNTLRVKGPVLCEICVSSNQEITPRIGFDPKPGGLFASRPMEDMYPYLPREKLEEILNIYENSFS